MKASDIKIQEKKLGQLWHYNQVIDQINKLQRHHHKLLEDLTHLKLSVQHKHWSMHNERLTPNQKGTDSDE